MDTIHDLLRHFARHGAARNEGELAAMEAVIDRNDPAVPDTEPAPADPAAREGI